MSFAGLKKRLKEKVKENSTGEKQTTASSSTASTGAADPTTSIYTAAVEEARANHTARKRKRSSSEEIYPVQAVAPNIVIPPETLQPGQLTAEKVIIKNLTEAEFLERWSLTEKVLLCCAKAISRHMDSNPVSNNLQEVNQDSHVYRVSALPQPLCDFLRHRLQRSLDASAVSSATCEDNEYDFVCSLKDALENNCDEDATVSQSVEAPVSILRTFWLALCWHWVMALRGTDASASCETGWSYNTYLLSRHALPDDVRNTRGREVALALEAWREAYRLRQHVLDFLAYLLHDVGVLTRNAEKKNQASEEDARIVPVEIVDALFAIVKNLRRRQFATCRQIYVDLMMGTANWKLGLFSGGEVHMRRSMERIERRRIEHLLHNEKAVRLLHALRELVDFVQKHEVSLKSSGLFYD